MLYEVAIIEKPTKKEAEESNAIEKLIYGPKAVVARDPQSAVLAAVMGNGAPKDLDMGKIEVLVRPFA